MARGSSRVLALTVALGVAGAAHAHEFIVKPDAMTVQAGAGLQVAGLPSHSSELSQPGMYPGPPQALMTSLAWLNSRVAYKFTQDGKLIGQMGQEFPSASAPPQNNQDTSILGQPAQFAMDEPANELYIADGYLNKRIVVYDRNTLQFKRGWGAYGIPLGQIDNNPTTPYDPNAPVDTQFRNPVHGVSLSSDGLVYVSDRVNDRYQVFTRAGQFLQEAFLRPVTLGNGSVWGITFSDDAQQKYLLIPDGENNVVWEILRSNGQVMGFFGHGGHHAESSTGCTSRSLTRTAISLRAR